MAIFTDQEIQEITELQSRYGAPLASLLPILWRIQEKRGWIDDEGMETAAALCNVPKSHVLGVVSFYTMFFDKPMGRFHVQVCTNVSCMLRGAEKIYEDVKSKLAVPNMGRTEDGMFSLEEVECMGACGGAPMMAVNELFYENINSSEALAVIEQIIATGSAPKPKFTVQLPELTEATNRGQ